MCTRNRKLYGIVVDSYGGSRNPGRTIEQLFSHAQDCVILLCSYCSTEC
jgi:hypothetical protein